MSSTEEKAYVIMRSLNVDYVLVIFGGMIGYSGDDINKFLWMVRIAEGEHPQDIKVREGGCSRNNVRKPYAYLSVSVLISPAFYNLSQISDSALDYSPPGQ